MGWHSVNRWLLLATGTALLAGTLGCPAPTPSEAVLEGTWKVVPNEVLDPSLTDWFVTFDANGNVTRITYTIGDFPAVVWTNPPAAAHVDGDNVFISATQGENLFTFTGTLNNTKTVITGELNAKLEVGDITIAVPLTSAVLTKQ